MKLKKLFSDLKACKRHRKDYYIKWNVEFEIDTNSYGFVFIPTIHWRPWIYRYPNESIIQICWLNAYINIGEWKNKGKV